MSRDQPAVDPFARFIEKHPQQGQRVLELNQEGQDLLDDGKNKAAERKFREAIDICEYAIPALNNLALCVQLRGNIEHAIRTAHRVLEFQPADVFAHCTLAECYKELGREQKALSHVERAMTNLENPNVPLDKLLKVLETLSRLGLDEKIMDLYRSYHEGIGFEEVMDGISWFYLGVAAANQGLLDDALSHWQRALHEDPRIKLAELYTNALLLVKEEKVPHFRFAYHTENAPETIDPRHPVEGLKPLVSTGLWSNPQDKEYGDHLVGLLGVWEDKWAEDFLRLIILRPDLPDQLKMKAATALIERGAIAEDEPVEMFIGGRKQPVVIKREEVTDPPPEAVKQFELGLAQSDAGNIESAEKAYRKALEIHPDFPEVMVNLANICRSTDRTNEAVDLLERAIELTGSPRAILNLAAVYIVEQNLIEEGEELLSLLELDELEEDLQPIYYNLIGHLHVSNGDFASARDAFSRLISLRPRDRMARGLLEWVERAEAVIDSNRAMRKRRRDRYLTQPVDPQMSLAMALHSLTKDNMIGIAHWYDISYGSLRKADLAQMLSDYLQAEDTDIWAELSAEAWDVVEFLRVANGSVPLAELEEKFGSTEDDSIDWKYAFPRSAIGELQISGIVFVGQDSSKETIAFIPRELFEQIP